MDSKGALAELKNFQGTRKGAGDYYSEAQKELGVGDAQTRSNDLLGLVRNTEKQLQGVGESVAGRTRGNLVTEAQRARLQSLEERPIAEQLGGLQTSYGDSQTNYRDLLSQAGTRAGMSYQTDSDRASALQNTYNNLFQQEQASAEEAARKREEDRWLKQFESERQAEARQFAEMQRQFNQSRNDTVNQYAQQASLYTSQNEANKKAQQDEEARQKALQSEATTRYNRQVNDDRDTKLQASKSSLPKYQTGNFLGDWLNSVGEYGPLALAGKGFIW